MCDVSDFKSVTTLAEYDGSTYAGKGNPKGYTSVEIYPEELNAELSSFVQKKSFAQNMMDIALLSANTNQLRYVIDLGEKHPYYMTSLMLIIISLVMQVAVGLSMVYLNRYNMKDKAEIKAASHMNNLSVAGVFLVTLVNVFISTFNGAAFDLLPAEISDSNGNYTTAQNTPVAAAFFT
uniref:Ninjurin a n=1 Tax=Anopheles epiroticus TaxID=199890 RepID=A0A182PHT9_9DIPT